MFWAWRKRRTGKEGAKVLKRGKEAEIRRERAWLASTEILPDCRSAYNDYERFFH